MRLQSTKPCNPQLKKKEKTEKKKGMNMSDHFIK